MLILMAGLPGSGKSTLCRELAKKLPATILDKDIIRAALFPAGRIEYSTEQDDFCMGVMLQTAEYILRKNPGEFIFLDGRPFSRRYQVDQAVATAESLNQPWKILECICSDETAKERLELQATTGEHRAANRSFDLYLRVKSTFEPITISKTVIVTNKLLGECVDVALNALR